MTLSRSRVCFVIMSLALGGCGQNTLARRPVQVGSDPSKSTEQGSLNSLPGWVHSPEIPPECIHALPKPGPHLQLPRGTEPSSNLTGFLHGLPLKVGTKRPCPLGLCPSATSHGQWSLRRGDTWDLLGKQTEGEVLSSLSTHKGPAAN